MSKLTYRISYYTVCDVLLLFDRYWLVLLGGDASGDTLIRGVDRNVATGSNDAYLSDVRLFGLAICSHFQLLLYSIWCSF